MVDVPAEVQIKATLRPGAVYYFPEDTFVSNEPHYFVVINQNPHSDSVILLTCISSQIESVTRRRHNCPPETIVNIATAQYSILTRPSIVDCNNVFEKSVEQLRAGVMRSPLVDRRIKLLLASRGT